MSGGHSPEGNHRDASMQIDESIETASDEVYVSLAAFSGAVPGGVTPVSNLAAAGHICWPSPARSPFGSRGVNPPRTAARSPSAEPAVSG